MRTDHVFLVGAQKCGTTTLFETLIRHPQIAPAIDPATSAVMKEPHYFSGTNWERGFDWYSGLYLDQSRVAIDATPDYMTKPAAIKMMVRMFPNCRVVLSLRDPVERALSAYNHYMQLLPETKGWDWRHPADSFDRNVSAELESPFEAWRGLVGRGEYAPQIQHIQQFVPPHRLFIMVLEEWAMDVQGWLDRLLQFLNLPAHHLPLLHIHSRGTTFKESGDSTTERLIHHYRPFNRQLFELLGRKVTQWQSAM